jgi:hypothetical protein
MVVGAAAGAGLAAGAGVFVCAAVGNVRADKRQHATRVRIGASFPRIESVPAPVGPAGGMSDRKAIIAGFGWMAEAGEIVRHPSSQAGITTGRLPSDAGRGAALTLDTLLLSGLLHASGGPYNPFGVLYLVHITLAAVVLGARWTWFLAALSVGCYGLLFVAHLPLEHLDHGGRR